MALQTASNPASPSAQMVGNAFVEQYYHILHTSPELVYRFYQDSSVLSRPDANGVMTSVATMQDINEKILSLSFKDYKAEIKTADAQNSYNEGVTVLVTGCLTNKENLRRKFAQSFFLAPQDNGYFVLNDVFRYVEDDETLENHPVNGVDNIPTVPSIPDPKPSCVGDPSAPDPATFAVEDSTIMVEKVNEPLSHDGQFASDREIAVQSESESQSDGNDAAVVAESVSASVPEDAPKKSYASIVKVAKGSSDVTKLYLPTNTAKVAPKKAENQLVGSIVPATAPEGSMPNSNAPESSNAQEEVEGHSIYIGNLPFDVTVAQLEAEFKKFGPIKEGGIQVRCNKQQGYCFGFVEFHFLSSRNDAIQASPMNIRGRQAVVEIKRTTTRVGSGTGRFSSGRPGFRSDSFRGRGNYGGGRIFGRNEFGSRGDFSVRSWSSSGRGEGYQPGRGRTRGGRSSGAKQNSSSA